MLIKDVMSKPAICVDLNTSIRDVVDLMDKKGLGFLPITKNDHLVGVVTDRDILLRSRGHKSNCRIGKIMTSDVYIVKEDAPIEEAAKIMGDNKIRRLVVVNSDYIKGVITSKDLLCQNNLIPYIEKTYQSKYL